MVFAALVLEVDFLVLEWRMKMSSLSSNSMLLLLSGEFATGASLQYETSS